MTNTVAYGQTERLRGEQFRAQSQTGFASQCCQHVWDLGSGTVLLSVWGKEILGLSTSRNQCLAIIFTISILVCLQGVYLGAPEVLSPDESPPSSASQQMLLLRSSPLVPKGRSPVLALLMGPQGKKCF